MIKALTPSVVVSGILVLCAVAVSSAVEEENLVQGTPTATREYNPDIPVAKELEFARRAGTVRAYDLFIARHPGHRFAEIARRERQHLMVYGERPDGPADPTDSQNPYDR